MRAARLARNSMSAKSLSNSARSFSTWPGGVMAVVLVALASWPDDCPDPMVNLQGDYADVLVLLWRWRLQSWKSGVSLWGSVLEQGLSEKASYPLPPPPPPPPPPRILRRPTKEPTNQKNKTKQKKQQTKTKIKKEPNNNKQTKTSKSNNNNNKQQTLT